MGTQPLLSVKDLSISFPREDRTGRIRVVNRVSFDLARGETLGIVGESGSGKTILGRAILRLLPPGGVVDTGSIWFDGADLASLPPEEIRRIRGMRIGMIFQEPMTSLNPSLTIGRQMTEGFMLHTGCSRADAEWRAVELLGQVQIADPQGALKAYPHAFSGGMRQRIMLGSVLMLEPDLLIADEPTTALDAVIQKEVLGMMIKLVRDLGTALILVSHDLPMVARYARDVIVMQRGELMESGPVNNVVARPRHPYTRALIGALPVRSPDRTLPPSEVPVLEVDRLSVVFEGGRTWPWSKPKCTVAVNDVSLSVHAGEVVGIVGESGSGKTTLGRAILDLVPSQRGTIRVDGQKWAQDDSRFRRDMQIIFQDPYSSLNPRMKVRQIVAEGLRHCRQMAPGDKESRVRETLDAVQMPLSVFGDRYPHELSGGQRQRICIARTVATRPRFVVADEPVSALDLTVQKEILNLIRELQDEMGFSALFISHDIGVVEEIADRIIVMHRGRIVEAAGKSSLLDRPNHPYTRHLISSVPELLLQADGLRIVRDRQAKALSPPNGYAFATPEDDRDSVVYRTVSPGHHIALVASGST